MENMIEVKNLSKKFKNKVILDDLSINIPKGKITVILGPSGCGKSVLLKHLIGLFRPDSGEIFVNNKDIVKMNENELNKTRKLFGMLFQSGALFDSLTVAENVGFALRRHTNLSNEEINKIVSEKLEWVGLPGIENMKPSEISGGMQKRVGLARAIAMDPEILLYDEPTTGLDPIMVTVIDKLTKKLQNRLKMTTIIVTHDMKSAFYTADFMAIHYGGKIIQSGLPDEIKNSNNPIVKQFINGLDEGPIKI
jgi:phospholipid/cholesterol/gamma-HCH transport system ATP-binding protein